MSYIVPVQPGIPDKEKKIIKRMNIVQEKHLTIEDLLWKHSELCAEICSCQIMANNIVDELIEINKILPVKNIPTKFKQEKN